MSPVPIQSRKRLPKPGMTEKQARAFVELRELEDKVRFLMRTEDVRTIDYIWYHTFARQVARFGRLNATLNLAAAQVRELVDRWVGQGLKRPVLLRILRELFRFALPD